MKTRLLLILAIVFLTISHAQSQVPINDECTNAQEIILTTTDATLVATDTAMATQSLIASCENTSQTWLDTWYHFTMPVNGNVSITSADFYDVFTLYANCADTMLATPVEINCSNDDTFYYNLIMGTTYTLRYANRDIYAGAKSFNIQAFETAANDDCANADVLSITTANATTVQTETRSATQSLVASCEVASQTWLDTWYQFTMPVNGNVSITSADYLDVFTLYANCADTMLATPVEINCSNNDTFYYNLILGTTYTLRYANRDIYAGAKSFNIQAFETAANDDCANAEILAVPTANAMTVQTETRGATQSLIASCEDANATSLDTWYQFTMPVNGNVSITSADYLDVFTLYANCTDTMLSTPVEISCSNNNTFFYNLIMGTTYTLRYANRDIYAGAKSFSIQAFEAAANDDCANAEVITVATDAATNVQTETGGASQSLISSCEDANATWLDIWYQFTMPVNGNVRITSVDVFDQFTLYANCTDTMLATPVEISCSRDDTYYYNLTMGTTYTLRYANRDNSAGLKNFNIQAFETAANDDCANAEVIAVTTAATTTVQTETGGANQSLVASCEDANHTWLDVWYQFTMPVNGNIRITSVDVFDQFTLYASCADTMLATPVEIGCSRDDTYYHNLTMGTTYTLRYANRDNSAGLKNFNIQAFETVANDDCANAEVIAVTTAAATTVQTETSGANQSLIASCEDANNTWLDIWYQFTMPVNGKIRITSADVFDQFTLYASCADTMLATPIEIGCSRDDTYYYDLIMGTTYTLRYANLQNFTGVKNFDIQAFEDIVNDDCANAEVIQVANIGLCATENVTIDSRRASVATNIGSCQNTDLNWLDAWYVFEAPLTGNINLNSNSGYNNFAVYDSCGGTEVACFNTSGVIPVVFGQTYLLQVMRTDSVANSFTFCLEGAPEIAPGTVGSCETLPDVTISTSQNNLNEWVPIIDANGNIAAAIHANGNDLGVVTTTLFVDAVDTRTTSNGQAYSRREVSISPTTQPTTNVSIRIYSLEDEITDLITADTDLNSYFGLDMMRIDGSGCTAGYTAGGDFINATTALYGADYYTGFNTNSFSVFYPASTNLDTTLSIDTMSSLQGVSIYPTISSGVINMKGEGDLGKTMLSVLDLNGRVIWSSEIDLDASPAQINLESASKGLYFLRLENNGNIKTQKIILK